MTAGRMLTELMNQVRRHTIRLVDDADPAWLTFAPPGTSNHMLWHAGHAVWLQDRLCLSLLGHPSNLSDDWTAIYGMNCDPVSERSNWPTQAEMVDLLKSQQEELAEALGDASDAQFDRVADPERGPLTVAQRIIHGFHDEARHSGEMYLLIKIFRAD